MTFETCQTIAGVLSVVLLSLVVERRNISFKITTTVWFRNLFLAAFVLSVVGLGLTVIGVQLNGWAGPWAVTVWLVCASAFLLFAAILLMHIVSSEVEEDDSLGASTAKPKKTNKKK